MGNGAFSKGRTGGAGTFARGQSVGESAELGSDNSSPGIVTANTRFVRFDEDQTLTDAQQLTARDNIGVTSGGTSTLDNLTDVNVPNPTNNQVLTFDDATSTWVNATSQSGGVQLDVANTWTALQTFSSGLDAGSVRVVNVATPTADTDATTKLYVDTADALKANLVSPTFTGTVTVPTPINNTDATTKLYVDTADALLAPLASPTFTGTVTVPTPTNNAAAVTKLYVDTADALLAPLANPTFTGDVVVPTPNADNEATTKLYVDTEDALKANLASPTFTGDVVVPTPGADNEATTKLYVDTADALLAPLASPTFTGTVTVPTTLDADADTVAASKGYVDSNSGSNVAVSDEGTELTAAVTSFNFTGAGVTATNVGDAVTVNIGGGGNPDHPNVVITIVASADEVEEGFTTPQTVTYTNTVGPTDDFTFTSITSANTTAGAVSVSGGVVTLVIPVSENTPQVVQTRWVVNYTDSNSIAFSRTEERNFTIDSLYYTALLTSQPTAVSEMTSRGVWRNAGVELTFTANDTGRSLYYALPTRTNGYRFESGSLIYSFTDLSGIGDDHTLYRIDDFDDSQDGLTTILDAVEV